jgi:hypothetical protein
VRSERGDEAFGKTSSALGYPELFLRAATNSQDDSGRFRAVFWPDSRP